MTTNHDNDDIPFSDEAVPAPEAVHPLAAKAQFLMDNLSVAVYLESEFADIGAPASALNTAVVESDTQLSIFVPDYVANISINYVSLARLVLNGQTSFPLSLILESSSIDETQILACKHFVPASDMIKLYKSELPRRWKYTEAPLKSTCIHPTIMNQLKSPCGHLPLVNQCRMYEAADWEPMKAIGDINGKLLVKLEVRYMVPRTPQYRVVTDSDTMPFNSLADANNAFDKAIAHYADYQSLTYETGVGSHAHYIPVATKV